MKDMLFFVIAWVAFNFVFDATAWPGEETHPGRHQKSILTLFTFTVVS